MVNTTKYLIRENIPEPYVYGMDIDKFTISHIFNPVIKKLILKNGLKSRFKLTQENYTYNFKNDGLFGYRTENILEDFVFPKNVRDNFTDVYVDLVWDECKKENLKFLNKVILDYHKLSLKDKKLLFEKYTKFFYMFDVGDDQKVNKTIFLDPRILLNYVSSNIKFSTSMTGGIQISLPKFDNSNKKLKLSNLGKHKQVNTVLYKNVRSDPEENLKLNLNVMKAEYDYYNFDTIFDTKCHFNYEYGDTIMNEITINSLIKIKKNYIKDII